MNDFDFADRLLDAVAAKGSPICIGLDPMFESLPSELREIGDDGAGGELLAIEKFCTDVLEIVAPIAPCIKLQSAYFEQYHAAGVETYYSLIDQAKGLGLVTIGDVKRGDIGSTSSAYALAHLLDPADAEENELASPDAITINPMLGMDSIEPFIDRSTQEGKGLFVLVRTSNPGSRDFQDVLLQTGKTWSEHVADTLQSRIAQLPVGSHGYSSVGAVVGATQPHTMSSLRRRLPRSIFLLPGYGTQGASADMTRTAFDDHGRGAIVSASRSVLYPMSESDWKTSVREAAKEMHDAVRAVSGAPGAR